MRYTNGRNADPLSLDHRKVLTIEVMLLTMFVNYNVDVNFMIISGERSGFRFGFPIKKEANRSIIEALNQSSSHI